MILPFAGHVANEFRKIVTTPPLFSFSCSSFHLPLLLLLFLLLLLLLLLLLILFCSIFRLFRPSDPNFSTRFQFSLSSRKKRNFIMPHGGGENVTGIIRRKPSLCKLINPCDTTSAVMLSIVCFNVRLKT